MESGTGYQVSRPRSLPSSNYLQSVDGENYSGHVLFCARWLSLSCPLSLSLSLSLYFSLSLSLSCFFSRAFSLVFLVLLDECTRRRSVKRSQYLRDWFPCKPHPRYTPLFYCSLAFSPQPTIVQRVIPVRLMNVLTCFTG